MRFRSIGVSASNLEEYLTKIKEKEQNYIEESTLAHMNFISINENNNNMDDEYDLLRPKANYQLKNHEKFRKRRRRRIKSNQYFKKKIFFHHKRTRINSESINLNNSKINVFKE